MNIRNSMLELIGSTPLLDLGAENGQGRVLVKLECMNPFSSIKDRVGLAMILDAEHKGLLKPGSTIVEPTSGNTGIALAAVGCSKGYRVVLTMPDTMSAERRALLKAYGAELVLTEGTLGMKGAIAKAKLLVESIPGAYMPMQFSNPANPLAHEQTTAREIWSDSDGKVDAFVAGVGTGGTISGVGRFLKSKNPAVRIIAVEPEDSPVLSGGQAGPHKIQGIGAGFLPEALDRSVVDEIIRVKHQDAGETARNLAKQKALLCGISSGANVWAARMVAARPEFAGKTVLTIICDSGERYLSTWLFGEQ